MEKEINNNIQESYCSFEVGKLLFAKGYRIPGRTVYNYNKVFIDGIGDRWVSEYPAPTHALAIEWIRVNFKKWIYIHGWTKSTSR